MEVKLKKIGVVLVCVVTLTSCLKEEIPVPPGKSGDVQSKSIEMMSDYRYRMFYDFETGKVVGQQIKSSWDLGFSCDENDFIVRLNSSKSMKAQLTHEMELNAVLDTVAGKEWTWEAASGDLDSLALGDIRSEQHVFVIDAGYNERGIHQGLYKIRFIGTNKNVYQFEWAEISELNGQLFEIEKDSSLNQLLFSFQTKNLALDQEPLKTSWDLVFTQFTQIVDDIPYLVTGALINPYQTLAYTDSALRFDQVTRREALQLPFTTRQDIPGFNWKTYNFDTGSYQIHSEKTYLFFTLEGFYWKIRFTDFYNESGQSGTPTFEQQRL